MLKAGIQTRGDQTDRLEASDGWFIKILSAGPRLDQVLLWLEGGAIICFDFAEHGEGEWKTIFYNLFISWETTKAMKIRVEMSHKGPDL